MQLPQIARAFFLRRPAESHECAFGCSDGAPCIFLVAKRDASDHFAVGRLDNVHDFAAVGFNECSIDIVGGDCSNPVSLCDRFPRCHCVSPSMRFYNQNEVTTTRVSEPSFNAAEPSFTSRSEIFLDTRSSRFI